MVQKQLEINFPNWKKLNRKTKKKLSRQIMQEVVGGYDYNQELNIPIEKLIGIDQQMPSGGIIPLLEMGRYIENFYSGFLFKPDTKKKAAPEITDPELRFVDELLDNQIINALLVNESYSPQTREIFPYQLFRM